MLPLVKKSRVWRFFFQNSWSLCLQHWIHYKVWQKQKKMAGCTRFFFLNESTTDPNLMTIISYWTLRFRLEVPSMSPVFYRLKGFNAFLWCCFHISSRWSEMTHTHTHTHTHIHKRWHWQYVHMSLNNNNNNNLFTLVCTWINSCNSRCHMLSYFY